ncbi:MAG: hypothetical protein MUE46_18005 [Xanthomonadales bacterium]|nr:hypothetical protein [Xanthomonadales bacterium]
MSRKIIIIAGPNGAGKTTFARAFLPREAQCPRFINADLIAAGLAPFAPETAAIRAGRLMLEEIAACARRGESFAFETTLAGSAMSRTFGRGGRRVTGSVCSSSPCPTPRSPSPASRCASARVDIAFRKT